MIGSSDDEDAPDPRRLPPRPTIQEQRARLHSNRRGTPIPRAPEDGMRIMSPPPPLPGGYNLEILGDPPRRARDGALHADFFERAIPAAVQRIWQAERLNLFHILHHHRRGDLPLGSLIDLVGLRRGQDPPGPQAPPEEYNVRMTHASVKPRIGFTFDFAPDEEAESAAAGATNPVEPQPRMRTTIVIPDSPPAQPVDRKGKGRMKEEDIEPEVLDLDDDEDVKSTINLLSSPIAESSQASSSSRRPQPRKPRQRQALEIVEFLSDDESDSPQEKAQTVLVCARCRRPLRTGGDRLWALRCGHMIDSRCYHKLAEPSEDMREKQELFPSHLEDTPSTSAPPSRPARKRARTNKGSGSKKGKAPAPAPTVPQVVQTLKWKCPVSGCDKTHTSEHVVLGGESSWRPAQVDGAIKVYI